MSRAPDHWLFRLSADEWLQAAAADLASGRAQVSSRRAAITYARRASGMALNGLLVAFARATGDTLGATQRWGRSYIDHLRALAAESDPAAMHLPSSATSASAGLLKIPVVAAQGLVQLGATPHVPAERSLELASTLIEAATAAAARFASSTEANGETPGPPAS